MNNKPIKKKKTQQEKEPTKRKIKKSIAEPLTVGNIVLVFFVCSDPKAQRVELTQKEIFKTLKDYRERGGDSKKWKHRKKAMCKELSVLRDGKIL